MDSKCFFNSFLGTFILVIVLIFLLDKKTNMLNKYCPPATSPRKISPLILEYKMYYTTLPHHPKRHSNQQCKNP